REVYRGALEVEVGAFGVGADEAVEIARLELVRVADEHGQVADAEVARARAEGVAEGQRVQGREAARAPARDYATRAVGLAAPYQILRAVHAVVHVNHAPLAVQALPVF